MDIMNLIEKNNSLYYLDNGGENEKLVKVSEENINQIKSSYVVINNELSINISESIPKPTRRDNVNMVSVKPVTNALKLVEKDKIIKHIDREDFLKISYPLILRKEDLNNYLISNNYSWNLDLFVKNNNFKILEI